MESEHIMIVFDYWRGEHDEVSPDKQITLTKIKSFAQVFVFISHEHIDHLDPIVFSWADAGNVSYIVSSDMPVGTRGKRMAPGDTLKLSDEVSVTAFDSTDLGVSYLIDFCGIRLFHAGDLNFWHWRDESTMREIEEAETEFHKAVQPLTHETIDIAFFPVDPRQGVMYEAGANYFILSVKPRILIPMHYFHRTDVAVEYARRASCRTTEVIPMPGFGDKMLVHADQEHYLNISFPAANESSEYAFSDSNTNSDETDNDSDQILSEDDPFLESDLPVASLTEKNHEHLST